MPELIGYDNDGNPQFSFSDEDKLKGITVRPHNALLDPAPVEAEQPALPVDVTGVGSVPTDTTGFVAADKLFGLNGQERFQTWPEKLVREAVSAPHKALTEGFVPGSDDEISAAQAMTSMAGMGSIPMAEKMALGSAGGKLIQPALAEKPAPVFYSALENAVNNITANKMPADQWLGTLTNAKGVRPEEMEWTGLKDFLAEQKGPVTKDQVQQYLDANKVELKEVNKGDLNELPKGYDVVKSSDGQYWNVKSPKGGFIASNFPSEIEAKNAAINFLKEANHPNPTKFEKYQLPGATNYRETLLTLPEKKIDLNRIDPSWKTEQVHEDLYKAIGKYDNDENALLAYGKTPQEALENAVKETSGDWKNTFKSSHWDEPNVLAHVRMNDRTIDGKKSLHLEELQSDWLQRGRDNGFALPADKIEKLRPQFEKIDEKLLNSNDEQLLGHPEVDGMLKMAVDKKIITPDEAKIYKQVSETAQTGAVPDAPFKKTWHELVLKRMLGEAAEKGYDRLSWTPGEAQAARYDLSKQVSELTYSPQSKELKAKGMDGGEVVNEKNVPPEKLADYVGKEAADKLMNNPTSKSKNPGGYRLEGNGPWSIYTGSGGFIKDFNSKTKALEELNNLNAERSYHHLSGLDLKVGGEGMKGFYDQIIPKALEKIGKEHGVKVKTGYVKTGLKDDGLNTRLSDNGYDPQNVDIQQILSDNGGRLPRWLSEEELNIIERGENVQEINGEGKMKGRAEEPIHYIDIPQSLKDQALRKGFPLFSSGMMLSPVEQSPFDNQPKLTPVPHNPFE